MAANVVLVKYIQERMKKDKMEKIRENLTKQGWQEKEIQEAIDFVKPKTPPGTQVFAMTGSSVPFGFSLAGGLGGLIMSIVSIMYGNTHFFVPLGDMGPMLGVIFSILIVVAAGLILKGRQKVGGIIVLILALVLLFIGASANMTAIGLIGAVGGAAGLAE